eukprot:CAMPEP_0173397008 /NCGR_PEP_ID=MMETSP1356-20130122/37143_1 /TAXON_ID=77927 ORGANISM="Hemiselmis virescens, Strain PCC157" /NCGR_SAMPLE_ID=MMETSP1356 /ASSEMBLY_ACC=CAM_ASM_000847 /LENGTH=94 /DNA_ID=CAMNT_0014356163 /DNA_START=125 /DNA_END=405 /DNA_ORIENTATION=-
MDLWAHEQVLASAHSAVHTRRLDFIQNELAGMNKRATAFGKRTEDALREELMRIERLESVAGVSLYEKEKGSIRFRLSRMSFQASKAKEEAAVA